MAEDTAPSQDAQRLGRAAMFLLVFGSRPTIKQALDGLLAAGHHWPGNHWPGDHTEGAA